jgi:hypothetical protein
MNKLNSNIEGILKEILSGNPIDKILNNPKEYPSELIEKISLETALKYWNGDLEYNEGDSIMNIIYGFWLYTDHYSNNYGFSDIAWECFNAFDSGEYIRNEDGPNVDPAEKYTKPRIENLLRRQKLIK